MPLFKRSLDRVLHPLDYEGRQQAKEAKLEKRYLKESRPAPLSSPRFNITQECLQVEHCAPNGLLFRLPFELRLQIYELVLGSHLLHLIHLPKRIRHIRFDPKAIGEVKPPQHQPAVYNVAFQRHITTTGLPLLLTCKTAYRESIQVLFSSNIFSLSDLNVLIYWSDLPLVPRQRIKSIRHLSIIWTYYSDPGQAIGCFHEPYNWATWQRFWTIVADEMPSLRTLELKLEYVGRWEEPQEQQAWVKAMMGVKGVKHATLDIARRIGPAEIKRSPAIEQALQTSWEQSR